MQGNNIFNFGVNGLKNGFKTNRRNAYYSKGVRPIVSWLSRFALRKNAPRNKLNIYETKKQKQNKGVAASRRRNTPGSGNSHGMPIRKACGRNDIERPKFDIDVKPNGYAWWYVDGISNDGNKAISIIGFIGSVFSPWYYWNKRKDPQNHVCINVAMYGKGWRWTMTERGKQKLKRTQNMLKVGPSSFNWNKDHLIINFDEYSIPHFDNVKGTVKIIPKFISEIECNLLSDNSHVWRPFSPISKIEVDINKPGWQWEGHGYFDANFGSSALEKDFSYWTWGRFPTNKGSYTFYDAVPRKEKNVNIALLFKNNGTIEKIFNPPDKANLSRSLWLVKRETRSDINFKPKQTKHMLDTPFYTRAGVQTSIFGEKSIGVHEALDLNRFSSPFLKPMLAVKAPRYNW